MDRLKDDPLERYQQLRDDPWLFLKYAVFTLDEVDQVSPIKLYPSHLEYLRFVVLMYGKRKKLAIPKSRRLTVSWTFIGLALHDCIFFRGRSWGLVSKKELDSLELVQRAKFIYDHIPTDIIPRELLPKLKRDDMQSSPPTMEFPELHSKIMGFPSGANQMRQRGFSGLFFDEAAFWEDAEAAYASAEPTVKGGGRMIMVSTRYPGFFKKIVYDQIDAKDLNFPETPPVTPESPMEGVDVWTNPNNGFTVLDISHRANPAKRDPSFEEGLRKSLPKHLADMEYGKSWANFEGKSVYEDFNPLLHLTQVKPKVWVGLPLLIGWDSSGLTPAVTISQLQEDQLVTVLELIGIGQGASRFCPHVAQAIALEFPQITDIAEQTISWFDPAGLKKSETNERTYLSYMVDAGFRQVRPGPMTWEQRKEAVTERLVGLSRGKPKALIYEKGCPILTAGFKGGYRYPDKVADVEPDKVRPVKDIHSHPHDSYQYKCGGLKSYIRENYNLDIPTPSYGFQKVSHR
jgi:hypothetical protein